MNGWIIAAIVIAALLLILCIPICIEALYTKGNSYLKVKWLFITLFDSNAPKKPKKKKKKKKKLQENPAAQQGKKKKKKGAFFESFKDKGIVGTIDFIKDTFEIVFGLLGDVSKFARLSRFKVKLKVSSSNAAKTAVLYGSICSAVYPACSLILNKIRHNKKKTKVNVSPDFSEGGASEYKAEIHFLLPVIFAIYAAIKAAVKYIILIVKNKTQENVSSNKSLNK